MNSKKHRNTTRSVRNAVFYLTVLLLVLPAVARADYRVLHHFAGGRDDGATAYGSLVASGSVLYGMTYEGGSSNLGTVFRINTDGTGFQVMHSFISGAQDGQWPIGSLILSGSTLYGMASSAASSYGGTLFRIGTDGSDFQVLRRFAISDGQWPWSSLLQSGSMLYGLNTYGGSTSGWNGKGTAFRINTDGTDFRVLHTFRGGVSDGIGPHGTFVQSGSTLYATTLVGGRSNLGTLFKMNPDGTGFQILHHFTGGDRDGSRPYNVTLVQSGPVFYGMTEDGGSRDMGTIFRINVDGTDFRLLHSFEGGAEGQKPFGSVILSGSTLYGLTSDENTGTDGTIFRINTDSTGFQVLHRFNGADGRDPCGSLLLIGTTLYGMASQGGSRNKGVIFAIDAPVLSDDQSWKYLGEAPPGETPVVFAPEIVSVADKNTHAVAIAPDEKTIIFSRYPDGTSYIMTYADDLWSGPVESPFFGKEVSFSPDGSRLAYYTDGDIFCIEGEGEGWSAPVRLGPNINTAALTEYYPSIVQDKSMYFSRDGNWNSGRIMYSHYEDGAYQPAVDLGLPVNDGGALHAWVAPDESYMLFNSPRLGSHTELDIWVSFRNGDGTWGNPKNLGEIVNSGADAILCPTVSPDGRYLFFTKLNWSPSGGASTGTVYWVRTDFIHAMNVLEPEPAPPSPRR